MSTQDNDITPAIFLQHMQGMEKRLREDFRKDLQLEIGSLRTEVHKGFEESNKRLEHLEQDVFVLVARKSAHEERLNVIEKVQLPKLRKSIRNLQKNSSDTPKPSVRRKTTVSAGYES